jgi:cobalt-zinc-cadmium efflux system membrane fusion protein
VPPLLIFTALGGLLAWGHTSGWTLPKFSALRGESAVQADDWCAEHNVPESECVECRFGLMPRPKPYGWCKEHGVHECPLHHPDVAQLLTPPVVTAEDLDRAGRALATADRPGNNSKCSLHKRRIQFLSAEAVEKAGIEVEPVWTAPVVDAVAANAEVTYDPTRTARLSSRAPGTVFRAFKQLGDPVRAGEVIALVDAAEVGRLKADLLQGMVQTRLKERTLEVMRAAAGAVPERTVTETEAALSEARIRVAAAGQSLTNLGLPIEPNALGKLPDEELSRRLRFLGLPDAVADTLDPKTVSGNLLPISSPIDGVVVTRDAVAGEVVDTAKVLFQVVDARRMWLTLDLREEDARLVRLGQAVLFRPVGGKAEVAGAIAWLSPETDHKTRTLKVRAALDNDGGHLKSNTFGPARIVLREESKAVVVPTAAVHWEGDCHVVFVRDKHFLTPGCPKVFHTRTVRVGTRDDRQTEIISGVLPGELVAVKGSTALRAELLRGNLGEGCECCK